MLKIEASKVCVCVCVCVCVHVQMTSLLVVELMYKLANCLLQ